jgi:hypothetical protein
VENKKKQPWLLKPKIAFVKLPLSCRLSLPAAPDFRVCGPVMLPPLMEYLIALKSIFVKRFFLFIYSNIPIE